MAQSQVKAASENDLTPAGEGALDFDDRNSRGEKKSLILLPEYFNIYIRDRSLFIGGGGGGGGDWVINSKKLLFFRNPLNTENKKSFRTPLFYWGMISVPPPNYKIRFNIITKFSILLNKHISPEPVTLPLRVVVIN